MSLKLLSATILAMPFMACNGIFAGIYDAPDDPDDSQTEFGFIKPCTASEPGIIYVDGKDFVHWNYIDFSEQTVVNLGLDDPEPET